MSFESPERGVAKPKDDRMNERVQRAVEGVLAAASTGRKVYQVTDDRLIQRAVLDELMSRGESRAIARHLGELGLETPDADWLLERGEPAGVLYLLERGGVKDKAMQLRWIEKLMEDGRLDIIETLINRSSSFIQDVIPGSVAAHLAEAGKGMCLERNMEVFRDGDLPESVALALIARGPSGISAVLGYRNKFSGFSQPTFDALHAKSPQLMDAVRMNLRQFHGLNQDAAEKLRAAGFAKEVAAYPEAFEEK